jgi:hypothetical protein
MKIGDIGINITISLKFALIHASISSVFGLAIPTIDALLQFSSTERSRMAFSGRTFDLCSEILPRVPVDEHSVPGSVPGFAIY